MSTNSCKNPERLLEIRLKNATRAKFIKEKFPEMMMNRRRVHQFAHLLQSNGEMLTSSGRIVTFNFLESLFAIASFIDVTMPEMSTT